MHRARAGFVLDDDRERPQPHVARSAGRLGESSWARGCRSAEILPPWKHAGVAPGPRARDGVGAAVGSCRAVTDLARFACLANVSVDVVPGRRGRGFGAWPVGAGRVHPDLTGARAVLDGDGAHAVDRRHVEAAVAGATTRRPARLATSGGPA